MSVVNSNRFNFAETVSDLLEGYRVEVVHDMTEIIPKVAKEAAKKLRKTSPKGATGEYARSWTSKVETGRINVGAVVYADAPGYRLAHLLEYGHANRNGGRTAGMEHIKPVEEWANTTAYDEIIEKLERGAR